MAEEHPCLLALRVRDVGAARQFYADAMGITLSEDPEGTHLECTWFDPYFHFSLYPATEEEPPSVVEFGFELDDVDAAHRRAVAAGAAVVREPESFEWGRSALYQDPDGNSVSLTQVFEDK